MAQPWAVGGPDMGHLWSNQPLTALGPLETPVSGRNPCRRWTSDARFWPETDQERDRNVHDAAAFGLHFFTCRPSAEVHAGWEAQC